jgi:hypothetical protein
MIARSEHRAPNVTIIVVMREIREKATSRLLRTSVQHALDGLEIEQRHQALPTPRGDCDECERMILLASTVSRVSLWLARRLSRTATAPTAHPSPGP